MAKDHLVYSTSKSQPHPEKSPASGPGVSAGPIKIRRESKGRGGKTVTVLFQLPRDQAWCKAQMKALQASCACGATMKDGMILLQGDVLLQVQKHFADLGIKAIHAGG
jgi:translation initiation factor 1